MGPIAFRRKELGKVDSGIGRPEPNHRMPLLEKTGGVSDLFKSVCAQGLGIHKSITKISGLQIDARGGRSGPEHSVIDAILTRVETIITQANLFVTSNR